MFPLQNKPGPISIGEAFIKNRDIGNAFETDTKKLIAQARSIDLLQVIRAYGIVIDEYSKKICCPFSFHKNETTASFFYYKNTNSFFCYGCRSGGQYAGASEFVSLMENIPTIEAAKRLVKTFQPDQDLVDQANSDFLDKHKLFIEFSNMIRVFIQANLDDTASFEHAEKMTRKFDDLIHRRKIDVDGIRLIVDRLKAGLNKWQSR